MTYLLWPCMAMQSKKKKKKLRLALGPSSMQSKKKKKVEVSFRSVIWMSHSFEFSWKKNYKFVRNAQCAKVRGSNSFELSCDFLLYITITRFTTEFPCFSFHRKEQNAKKKPKSERKRDVCVKLISMVWPCGPSCCFWYCNFTNFRCVKISVASNHGAFGFV